MKCHAYAQGTEHTYNYNNNNKNNNNNNVLPKCIQCTQ